MSDIVSFTTNSNFRFNTNNPTAINVIRILNSMTRKTHTNKNLIELYLAILQRKTKNIIYLLDLYMFDNQFDESKKINIIENRLVTLYYVYGSIPTRIKDEIKLKLHKLKNGTKFKEITLCFKKNDYAESFGKVKHKIICKLNKITEFENIIYQYYEKDSLIENYNHEGIRLPEYRPMLLNKCVLIIDEYLTGFDKMYFKSMDYGITVEGDVLQSEFFELGVSSLCKITFNHMMKLIDDNHKLLYDELIKTIARILDFYFRYQLSIYICVMIAEFYVIKESVDVSTLLYNNIVWK